MGYIYKITNHVNGKSYIGQTITSINTRMLKHFSNAKKATTGIDYAIQKYGKENFEIEQVCECANENLDDLERYYIQYYNTYNDGYNLTTGGQDISTKIQLNEFEVVHKYLAGKTIKELCELYNCCDKVISRILHDHKVPIRHNNNESNLEKGKKFQVGENTKAVYVKEVNKTFASLKECAEWFIQSGYSKASSMELARKSLSRALNGDRKTYCKLHVEFV